MMITITDVVVGDHQETLGCLVGRAEALMSSLQEEYIEIKKWQKMVKKDKNIQQQGFADGPPHNY